jgi:CBS-domain-containing membrane protein
MLSVADIMTPRRSLVIAAAELTVGEARRVMAAHRIRHLPVVDTNGGLLGLVSRTDVFRCSDDDPAPVASVMVARVHTVDARADARAAAGLLARHKIGCLPVLRHGRLAGIVTDSDFVNVAISMMDAAAAREDEPEPA